MKETIHQLKGDLDWIVMKCLEKDRTRRYETANGLAADLKRHLGNEPVTARPPSAAYRLQKMVRRNKIATLATAGILAALAIGVGLAMAALVRERAADQREIAAKQRELGQSVRADTVTSFINFLLSDTLPMMIRQGNSQGARELVNTADRLATSSLSNAPAAEVELRHRLAGILSDEFNDFQAALSQAERIQGLLPRVSDEQLKIPRALMRIRTSSYRLWAANGQRTAVEKAMQELEALHGEFVERTPPGKYWAAMCRREQGRWFMIYQKPELAEEKLAAAYGLLRKSGQEVDREHYSVLVNYSRVLANLGKLTQAEEIARENLQLSPGTDEATRERYLRLVEALADSLCQQARFGEALRMLEEQRRLLADRGGSEANLLNADALRGDVLARSGDAEEALKVYVKVSSHPLSSVGNWGCATTLAVATGQRETCRELCRTGVLRFASTVQGKTALNFAGGLLAGPTDEMTLSLARGILERVAGATDWSQDVAAEIESMLALREHRHAEALAILDRYLGQAPAGLGRVLMDAPAYKARSRFIRALACTKLDRREEARRDFAQARAQLKTALGDQPGHDRGRSWWAGYEAESWQREAEALFKAKGIPLPELDAK